MSGPGFNGVLPGDFNEEMSLDFDLKDESNPNSLVNLLPKSSAEILRKIPDEILAMSEKQLRRFGNIGRAVS